MVKGIATNDKAILLYSDDQLQRYGISRYLTEQISQLRIVLVETKTQIRPLLKNGLPAVLLLDLVAEGRMVFQLIEEIRKVHRALPMLVLSKHSKTAIAERCLRSGANGYLDTRVELGQLPMAIQAVVEGQVYLSSKLQTHLLTRNMDSQPSEVSKLSRRELDIFHLLGRGKTVREIARELDLSAKTIESYRDKVKEKLNYKTSHELNRHALEFSVLQLDSCIVVARRRAKSTDAELKPAAS